MTAFGIQTSFKTPSGALHNIQGDHPEEWFENLEAFREKLDAVLGLEAEIQEKSREIAPGSATAVVVNSLGGTIIDSAPTPTLNPAPAAAAYAAPAGAPEQVTDKWGNQWEYNNPAAPPTPRGPAVKKTAISSKGNPYSKWVDPAKGPKWYPQPKPADIIEFEGFAR